MKYPFVMAALVAALVVPSASAAALDPIAPPVDGDELLVPQACAGEPWYREAKCRAELLGETAKEFANDAWCDLMC